MTILNDITAWLSYAAYRLLPQTLWGLRNHRHDVAYRLQDVQVLFPWVANRIAFFLYAREALEGNLSSQNNLAVCYATGVGVEQSEFRAFLWYKRSACGGSGVAMHSLGWCCYNGFGVKVDYKRSFDCFFRAVQLGNVASCCYLGLMYSHGEGVLKNEKKTYLWYKKGALSGDANCQYDLSICYRSGEGVSKDVEKSLFWLRSAAANGSEEAREAFRYGLSTGVEGVQKRTNVFIYYVVVQADFIIPVRQFNAPQSKPFVGFVMEFGCTVSAPEMLDDFIKHYVEKGHEGNIASIHKEQVENIPTEKISHWILADEYISQSLLQDPLSEGIWYTTGHGYFWNDPWYSCWYIWVFAALSLLVCGLLVGRYFL